MTMRALLQVTQVLVSEGSDLVSFTAVCRDDQYPEDGSDEDNTFARWSPSASFEITIANPALFGKFRPGQRYYVDFSEAPSRPAS
jgi:hypothetical protein